MSSLKEVAKLSGVTPMTVSRVINNPSSVKESTRIKVEEAIKELGYVSNIAAKNLVKGRNGVICVSNGTGISLSNPFSMYFISGVSSVLSEKHYPFIVVEDFREHQFCDGYIVTGIDNKQTNELMKFVKQNKKPFSLFGHVDYDKINCVDVDNKAGAKLAINKLVEAGHRKIAIVIVDEEKDYVTDRMAGYKEALEENNIPFSEDFVIAVENTSKGGEVSFSNIKELMDEGITAVFCSTDTIAVGLINALRANGYKVPKNISVIGFDGLGHNYLSNPIITTIRQPIYEAGQILAETLIDTLENKSGYKSIMIEPDFLEGQSVKRIKR